MKKNVCILIISLCFISAYCGEYPQFGLKQTKFTDNIVFGGNLGLQFGTYTQIDISPRVGYRFTERFVAGIGGTYRYISLKYYNERISTSIYGGAVFTRFFITENLFAHAECEFLNLETKYFAIANPEQYDDRFWIPGLLVGGGYRVPIGESSYLATIVLFNLNDTPNSPYQNPIIRVGFMF